MRLRPRVPRWLVVGLELGFWLAVAQVAAGQSLWIWSTWPPQGWPGLATGVVTGLLAVSSVAMAALGLVALDILYPRRPQVYVDRCPWFGIGCVVIVSSTLCQVYIGPWVIGVTTVDDPGATAR